MESYIWKEIISIVEENISIGDSCALSDKELAIEITREIIIRLDSFSRHELDLELAEHNNIARESNKICRNKREDFLNRVIQRQTTENRKLKEERE